MNKFLRVLIPAFFYILSHLVMQTMYYIADTFEIGTKSPLFLFLTWLIVCFCVCAFFWSFGSLIRPKLPTLCRILHILPAVIYISGVVMTFINIFVPFFR